jgi:hypothetical protein
MKNKNDKEYGILVLKFYWYPLDPELSSFWDRFGVRFFKEENKNGFEISLVVRNFIMTWEIE